MTVDTASAGETAPDGARAAGASGSSFYAAMRILPAAQRRAMFAIYGFCRAVDDIADDPGPRALRQAELNRWRDDIRALYEGRVTARTRPLAETVARFELRQTDFLAVIDGMEMDLVEDIRAPDLDMLDLYCDRVASAVGRLSVRVFGVPGQDGERLAVHLGRALQLTNILRDLDEDAERGRLYLPREFIERAGITSSDPAAVLAHPAIATVCGPVAVMARDHFAEAEAVLRRCPRRAGRAPRLMARVYGTLLDRLVLRGWTSPRLPVRLSRAAKIWMLLRYGLL
jgi:phytoene synthase